MTTTDTHVGNAVIAAATTQHSGSNFSYAFFFLPRPRREAMQAVYALCHALDDTVDHPPRGVDPRTRLEQWRTDIDAMYHGTPQDPATVTLARHVHTLGIPREYFQELVNGMDMDVTISRYATFDELSLYCYRVASVVGLICLKVFGVTDPRANEYAIQLGMAFQLTNIMRDVGADAARGRIYLPREDLDGFDYSEQRLVSHTYSPQFVRLMEYQAARARRYYQDAQTVYDVLAPVNRRALLPAEIMRAIYFGLFTRIEHARFAVFASRIRVPPPLRLLLALHTWTRALVRNRVSPRT